VVRSEYSDCKNQKKMAAIKEVQEKGSVAGTCRKYSIPGMYYRWKESYDSFGIDGLKAYARRMEPGMRKLVKENARLRKLLAEKELANEMREALKKGNGKEMTVMASDYIGRGIEDASHSTMLALQATWQVATDMRKENILHDRQHRRSRDDLHQQHRCGF
jgi:formate dehydrogenase maturation protein FdhE